MGLVGFITLTRYLAIFACLAAFGLDMYFLTLYQNYTQVVIMWEFIAQMGIIGAMILTLILSEIAFRILIYRQRHRERYYAHDFGTGAHNPYISGAEASAPGTGPVLIQEPKPYYYKHDRSCCSTFWSIIRFIFVWVLAAGILRITIDTYIRQGRSIFTLPFSRYAPQGINSQWRDYDPRDLFNCRFDDDWSDPLSRLCTLDNVGMFLATIAGALIVIEAVATIIFENRDPRPRTSRSNKGDITSHTTETIRQEELGHSHVVVVAPPPVELQPYGAYHQQQEQYSQHAASGPTPNLSERSLPPLPPRPPGEENDDGTEDAYAAAVKQTKAALSPFEKESPSPNVWVNAADEKNKMRGVYSRDNNTAADGLAAYETLPVEEESLAGPSHSYPPDVKRKDGSSA
ncbi:hypothetical protein BGX28_006439 [Mortierella sp. GBA30]|nr:hypothetical protein BGX28_006439 [Mortierella sp. GBA30]